MVIISALLHCLLFIPYGRVVGMDKPPSPASSPLINYTFIRGMPKETEPVVDINEKNEPEEKIKTGEETIGSLTGEEIAAIPSEKKSGVIEKKGDPEHPDTSDIKWFPFDKHPSGESYSKELNRLINAELEIPEELLRTGYEGKQVVFFKLSKDGQLKAIFIDPKYESSDPLVNETSIANIRRIAEKFPPLPEGVEQDEVWFHVEIDYAK
jgi:hypothetical protein